MNDYRTLRRLFRKTSYLVMLPDGEASLASEDEVLKTMCEDNTATIVNLGRALEGFARLVGENDRAFKRPDVAKVLGLDAQMVSHLEKLGVLSPSVQKPRRGGGDEFAAKFSWADTFAAGVVGTLRRHGLGYASMKAVQPLLANKKRTPPEAATSAKS